MYLWLKNFKKRSLIQSCWGDNLEFITLDEKKNSRIYNFIEINEATGLFIHKQIENRGGKIFMRARRRSLQI
jgi:hypothetical protein